MTVTTATIDETRGDTRSDMKTMRRLPPKRAALAHVEEDHTRRLSRTRSQTRRLQSHHDEATHNVNGVLVNAIPMIRTMSTRAEMTTAETIAVMSPMTATTDLVGTSTTIETAGTAAETTEIEIETGTATVTVIGIETAIEIGMIETGVTETVTTVDMTAETTAETTAEASRAPTTTSLRCSQTRAAVQSATTETAVIATTTAMTTVEAIEQSADRESPNGSAKP
jgi:hypothetical protein